MTEPILSDDEVDAIYERVHAEWEARNKCSPNLWVAFAAAVLKKVCGEPVAWILPDMGTGEFTRRTLTRSASIAERHGGKSLYALTRSKP